MALSMKSIKEKNNELSLKLTMRIKGVWRPMTADSVGDADLAWNKGVMLGIKSTIDVKLLQVGFLDLATNEFSSSARSDVSVVWHMTLLVI
jgi:hypothetical protein